MTLISVCIPSYNASRFIAATLRSVRDSSYTNLEIVISDDASTDDTPSIVERFADDRIRLYRNKRPLGAPRNWNRALEHARGDLVGLLNHDDLYGPFWLSFVAHTLERHPHIGWVGTAFRVIDAAGQALYTISRFVETREYSCSEAFRVMARLDGFSPAYIARREVLEQIGRYDEAAGASADNDLFLRLASRSPLYYSSNPHHAAWRWHDDNLTQEWGLVQQVSEGLRTLRKVFNDPELPGELREQERACYTYFYHKALTRTRQLVEEGDIENADRVLGLLHARGYAHRNRS